MVLQFRSWQAEMRLSIITLSLALFVAFLSRPSYADESSLVNSAGIIQSATVTVRIATFDKGAVPGKLASRVTVFSGVSLGNGLLVTPLFTATGSPIRVTLPGGAQAEAKPLVFDEYSGLALLEMDRKDFVGLTLAGALPKEGSRVISAAAWGVEKAIVSRGIVSGVERKLKGANYPPLLLSDVRTAETSSGAGIVNQSGELLGVIVAAEQFERNRGWAYAVPVKHIQRLLNARLKESPSSKRKYVVLQRRKPVVGMVLEGNPPNEVIVQHVTKGQPADKAGIKKGDLILKSEGTEIRSVYQAVSPLHYKQPGDKITFLVKRNGIRRSVEVTLGGGVVLPGIIGIDLASYLHKKVIVDRNNRNILIPQKHDRGAASVTPGLSRQNTENPQPTQQQTAVQQKALDGYLKAIDYQQKQIKLLKKETERLKKMVDTLKKTVSDMDTPANK